MQEYVKSVSIGKQLQCISGKHVIRTLTYDSLVNFHEYACKICQSVLMGKPFSSGKHVIHCLTYDSLLHFHEYVSTMSGPYR